ncbi:MAG: hypothetical protein AB1644_11750 [Candidatus Zixiibacteriota bacterium]
MKMKGIVVNNRMFRLLVQLSTLLLMTSAATAFGADVETTSKWATDAMVVDGHRSDWPAGAIGFLKEPEASVGLCNDSQNLYVVLTFRNPQWAIAIRRGGLTLWLDNKGKKKKEFMLKFTGGPGPGEMQALVSDSSRRDRERPMPGMGMEEGPGGRRAAETTLVCFQKDRIAEKQIPLDGREGPSAAFGEEEGFFVYEFSVPLRETAVLNYGLGAKPDEPVSVGFLWGGLDRDKMDRPKGGFEIGGMGDGMGGGMPGGGGPGGQGGPREGGRMGKGMPKKQEVWLKARLAAVGSESK